MGIKDINKNLQKLCPEAFKSIPLESLRGKAIGIDASLWLFRSKSSAMKDALRMIEDPLEALDSGLITENLIKQMYGFVYKLMMAGITPVWIFDGPSHPAKLAVQKRKTCREKIKTSIDEERSRIGSLDILSRKKEYPEFVRLLLTNIFFTKNEEQSLYDEIHSLGLPIFRAPHDGEIFASVLSRRGLLYGVWTTDTDTYAVGAYATLSNFSKGYSSEGTKVDAVIPSVIIEKLGITHSQFVDFCILHECDFNLRIPKLGPVGILKKMETYNWDLDLFKEKEPSLPWEMVNIELCREIFKGPDTSEISADDLKIDGKKWTEKIKTLAFTMPLPDIS